jgi:transposase InsO family protein
VLRELTVVEQRYLAVMEVIRDGWKVIEVAERHGVSRQSVHAWLRRYQEGGLEALGDRSHRPVSCPHQMPAEVEVRVCELRRLHPSWGPATIVHQLGRDGLETLPSLSGVYRALVRHGLIDPKTRRRKRKDYVRWERDRPMELWQLDVMGGVLLADGTELKLVDGLDDHSRFCVAAGLVPRATARAVCGVFADAMRRYGVPDEVLTDNAKVFTGRLGPHPVEVLFERICRENGVIHRLTGVRSPTTTGKIERFHRTLRTEFLPGRVFATLEEAQAALDAFVADYNTNRPHQSLGMLPPIERFRPGSATAAETVPAHVTDPKARSNGDGQWVNRRVASNGIMCIDWQVFSVGRHHGGQIVDVHVGHQVIEVWSDGQLIKTVLRQRQGEIRNLRAQARPLPRTKKRGVKAQPNTPA